jgi:hypothetical protein
LLQPGDQGRGEGYIVAPRIAFDWKKRFEKAQERHQHRALSACRTASPPPPAT